jgi:hypothetical protein
MKSTILTIFPPPTERYPAVRTALTDERLSSRAEGLQPTTGAVNVVPSIEAAILQKLLAEMEARQIKRVQPTYVIEPPARQVTSVRVLLGLLWASSIAVSILAVKYVDSQTMIPKASDRQSRSIENLNASIFHQNEAFSSLIDSLQQLVGTIAASAKRAKAIPEIPERLGNNLQEIRSPAVTQAPQPVSQPAMPVIIGIPPRKDDSAPIPMGGHIHPPIEWAVAPPNVVVHHNSAGVMDYWLVPRILSGVSTMVKVVPIVQTNSGTFVHDIAEIKDYTITPSGDWIDATEPIGNKE